MVLQNVMAKTTEITGNNNRVTVAILDLVERWSTDSPCGYYRQVQAALNKQWFVSNLLMCLSVVETTPVLCLRSNIHHTTHRVTQ